MSKLDQMQNLRGGAIYTAAGVAPTTVRSWGIKLGESEGEGHPRYNAVDAVMAVIMRQLTTDVSLTANTAARIVNTLRPALAEEVARVVKQQESTGRWDWDGGTFAVVSRRPSPNIRPDTFWLRIVSADKLAPLLTDRGSGMTPLVISLNRAINTALMRLQQVIYGDLDEVSEPA